MADHAPSTVALADAVGAGVPPTWTEAVALIRELARQLAPRGAAAPIPSPAQILVLPTGGVQLTGGAAQADGAVAGLGRLLGELLQSAIRPEALLAVQQQAVGAASFPDLADLTRALDPWSHRDPQGELAGYYNRAARVLEAMAGDQAARQVPEGSASRLVGSVSPRASDGFAWGWRRPQRSLTLAAIAVALVLGVVQGDALWTWIKGPASQTARATMNSMAAVGRRAASSLFGRERDVRRAVPAPKRESKPRPRSVPKSPDTRHTPEQKPLRP